MFDVNDPEKEGDLDSALVNQKIARVKEYLSEFEAVLITGDFKDICKYIDVNSFIDMYIAHEYFKNADFNFSSTRFYIKNNKIYAGPLWDFDLSCGNYNPRTSSHMYEDGESYKGIFCREMLWFEKLFECEEFDQMVKDRFKSRQFVIQNMYKKGSTSELSIDYLVDNFGKSFERDSANINERGAGWSLQGGGGYVGIGYTTTAKWTQWEQPIEFVRDWLENRNAWLCEQWGINMDEAYEETTDNRSEITITQVTSDEAVLNKIKFSKVNISSANKKKAKARISLRLKKKVKIADGYELIFYSRKKQNNKSIILKTKVSVNKKKLFIKSRKFKKYKKIYVRIRAYKVIGNKKIYSLNWSTLKKVKIK